MDFSWGNVESSVECTLSSNACEKWTSKQNVNIRSRTGTRTGTQTLNKALKVLHKLIFVVTKVREISTYISSHVSANSLCQAQFSCNKPSLSLSVLRNMESFASTLVQVDHMEKRHMVRTGRIQSEYRHGLKLLGRCT